MGVGGGGGPTDGQLLHLANEAGPWDVQVHLVLHVTAANAHVGDVEQESGLAAAGIVEARIAHVEPRGGLLWVVPPMRELQGHEVPAGLGAVEDVAHAPQQPVDLLPTHPVLMEPRHTLGEAPDLEGHVPRNDCAPKVHGGGCPRAVEYVHGPEVEEAAAPAAAADLAVALALLRVEGWVAKVDLQPPFVQLGHELVLFVLEPHQEAGIHQLREALDQFLRDTTQVERHLDDLRQPPGHVPQAVGHQLFHLEEVRGDQNADHCCRLQFWGRQRVLDVSHEPLEDVHIAVHRDVNVVFLGRVVSHELEV
mmetsp:Transcript_30438/g.88507  ORF Transcript_30438/g.88507 Transcript_30438/m.88507 type:complete len:308 (-) Transcript_30438:803-1726(-)